MAKKEPTTENRVYLFETLAATLLEGKAGDLLTSANAGDRERAIRVMADLAYVSCVLADSEDLDAATVRARVLGEAPVEAPAVKEAAAPKSKPKKPKSKTK